MQQVIQEVECVEVAETKQEIKELSPAQLAWVGGGTGSFDNTL